MLAIESSVFAQSAWTPEQFFAELAGVPDTRFYVAAAEQDDRLVGYAGLALNGETADVMSVAVAARAQRRGTGRALVAALLAHAAERRVREVLLEVHAGNETAIRLYSSLGFERIARRRDYYGPQAHGLVMRRRTRRQEQWTL